MELALHHPQHFSLVQSRGVLGKALQGLQEEWGFTNTQMARLIRVKPNTYGYWMQKQEVPFHHPPYSTEIEIILALLSIFRSLGAMFVSSKDQLLWLNTSHPQFGGESPLEFAKHSSENLFYLKQYLDYVRGRGA